MHAILTIYTWVTAVFYIRQQYRIGCVVNIEAITHTSYCAMQVL